MTAAQAQAVLGEIACQLLFLSDLLESVHRDLPPPADIDERIEHEKPYDVATEVLATIECVQEDRLRPAIESLQRAAQVTDAGLRIEFEERRTR
jgi:hypothetical protein